MIAFSFRTIVSVVHEVAIASAVGAVGVVSVESVIAERVNTDEITGRSNRYWQLSRHQTLAVPVRKANVERILLEHRQKWSYNNASF